MFTGNAEVAASTNYGRLLNLYQFPLVAMSRPFIDPRGGFQQGIYTQVKWFLRSMLEVWSGRSTRLSQHSSYVLSSCQ